MTNRLDDEALGRALHRAADAGAGVDVTALLTGAHGRARVIRRRRRATVGAVAVLALAVPVGWSQVRDAFPAPNAVATQPATPTRPVPTQIPDQALLSEADVTAAMGPGLTLGGAQEGITYGPVRGDRTYGLCNDTVLVSDVDLRVQRQRAFTQAPPGDGTPVQGIMETLQYVAGDGPERIVARLRAQLTSECVDAPMETGPWSPVTVTDLGDETVAGVTLAQTGLAGDPTWRVAFVTREGSALVRLDATVYTPEQADAVAAVEQLARAAVDRAVTETEDEVSS